MDHATRARTATVLLLEGPAPEGDRLGSMLDRAEFRVLQACTARDALDLLAVPPDLIIIDYRLLDLGGYEICRAVKTQPTASQTPIIIAFNGSPPATSIITAIQHGADDYIQRPFSEGELRARIHARLAVRNLDQRWTNRLLQQQGESARSRIARLNAALEIAELGVWELTAQLGVWQGDFVSTAIQFDQRCFRLFGVHQRRTLTLDEFIGLIHSEDRLRVRSQLNSSVGMYKTGMFDAEFRIVRPDGTERTVAMHGHEVTPDIIRGSVSFVGTLMDLTERRRTLELLSRSERVAALGQMAATLAHEINNPLAAVMNSLFLARTNCNDKEQVTRYLNLADEQLRQVAHVTRRALGFYREDSRATQVSVQCVLEETVRLLSSKIGKKKVVLEIKDADPRVVGVGGELRQVFSNLLANSLDALPEHGTIRLRVSRLSHNGASRLRVTVADNGKGIEPSALRRVFEPLFTTKGNSGTGLGLWVSKQIIEKHGGGIRVRSRTNAPHRGTVFAVFLPTPQQQGPFQSTRPAA